MSLNDVNLDLSKEEIESITEALSNLNCSKTKNTMVSLNAAKEMAHTLKTFSGKPEHLEFFIKSIDTFYNRYNNTSDESLQEFVFATICCKITDEAGDHLLCHPELISWPLIKTELRSKFGDKINRHTLSQQLNFLTKNKNESTLEFLDRIKILKNRINLKINTESLLQSTKVALVEQNELTAVTVLLGNVNSELRTILMINQPTNLDDTYNTILNHSLVEQQLYNRSQMIRNTSHVRPYTPQAPTRTQNKRNKRRETQPS